MISQGLRLFYTGVCWEIGKRTYRVQPWSNLLPWDNVRYEVHCQYRQTANSRDLPSQFLLLKFIVLYIYDEACIHVLNYQLMGNVFQIIVKATCFG